MKKTSRIIFRIKNKIKNKLTKYGVSRLRTKDELFNHFYCDYIRFKDSALYNYNCQAIYSEDFYIIKKETFQALLTIEYHRIEKGISLKDVRDNFGEIVVTRLIEALNVYISRFSYDEFTDNVISVLDKYLKINKYLTPITQELIQKTLASANVNEGVFEIGGARIIDKNNFRFLDSFNPNDFFNNRFSIREFLPKPIPKEVIEEVVNWAIKTPSVCNRQGWGIYWVKGKEKKQKVLELQNGNAGFRNHIEEVLIVTAKLNSFFSIGERNQAWIDGGMFSMSLVYALHAKGLGSCCLNWCVDINKDNELREIIGINKDEVVLMIIAAGYLPNELKVTYSNRKKVSEVLTVI